MSVTVVGIWDNDAGHYRDEWFHESCESIKTQTHRDFKWLICFYGEGVLPVEDDRLTVIHRPDLAYMEARAFITGEADTTWACVQDCDDVYGPRLLEAKLEAAQRCPHAVAIGACTRHTDPDGNVIPGGITPESIRGSMAAWRSGQRRPPIHHPGMFIRMDAYRACGGYHSDMKRGADSELWPRLLKHGDIVNVSEFLIRYRRHGGQVVSRIQKR